MFYFMKSLIHRPKAVTRHSAKKYGVFMLKNRTYQTDVLYEPTIHKFPKYDDDILYIEAVKLKSKRIFILSKWRYI